MTAAWIVPECRQDRAISRLPSELSVLIATDTTRACLAREGLGEASREDNISGLCEALIVLAGGGGRRGYLEAIQALHVAYDGQVERELRDARLVGAPERGVPR